MNQKSKKTGFTIIELLTVMSIIVLIISMLVPALNSARKYGKVMAQHAQFKSISEGLEEYYRDFGDYPPSDFNDNDANGTPAPSCGAMKLCEAMVGQDGLGLHPDSTFAHDETAVTTDYYPFLLDPDPLPPASEPLPTAADRVTHRDNLLQRAHYLDNENIRASRLKHLYGQSDMGVFNNTAVAYSVLCDAFPRVTHMVTIRRVGMPILYYKADTSKFSHDVATATNLGNPGNPDNIYDYRDNHLLTFLATPNVTGEPAHSLYQIGTDTAGEEFYRMTLNKKVSSSLVPHKKNSYILISAGWDGIYGTGDDVTNFNE